MRVAEVADEVRRALPEVAMRSLEPEELGQLRAREVERQPRLETDQHGFRKEPDRIASPDRPGDECDCGHHERHARGERGVTRRITAAQFANRGADEQRQRRSDGDDRMAGAAEQPEDETRKETRVKSCLRRQASERRVADSCGQQVCGERQPGDDVRPQPRELVARQPAADGERALHYFGTIVRSSRRSLPALLIRCSELAGITSMPPRTTRDAPHRSAAGHV